MLLAIFIGYPWLAAIVGVLFLLMYGHAGRLFLLFVGIIWLLYTAYEYAMKQRILCTGECNIRVDLLLIYPVLLVLSISGLVSYISFLRSHDQTRTRGPTT